MAAANLLRECESMEAEIAMLKNKRSAAEVSLYAYLLGAFANADVRQRITIDEALALQDEQLDKMAQVGPRTAAATEKISATKSSIKKHKAMYEKLEGQKKEMNKEQADRELKGTRDERAEEACRWCVRNAIPAHA